MRAPPTAVMRALLAALLLPAAALRAAEPAPVSAGTAAQGVGEIERALALRHAAGSLGADVFALGEPGQGFLSLYAAAARLPAGPALLLVPAGDRIVPADPLALALLRRLGNGRSAVLVPQMPPFGSGVTAEATFERVRVAAAHLHAQGAQTVVLAGEGDGIALAARCVTECGIPVAGFAAVGPGADALDVLEIPVLEMVPADAAAAVRQARQREAGQAAGAARHRLLSLPEFDRRHPGYAEEVAARLHGWLARLARTRTQWRAAADVDDVR